MQEFHEKKINPDIIDDIELEIFEDYEIEICYRQWENENRIL